MRLFFHLSGRFPPPLQEGWGRAGGLPCVGRVSLSIRVSQGIKASVPRALLRSWPVAGKTICVWRALVAEEIDRQGGDGSPLLAAPCYSGTAVLSLPWIMELSMLVLRPEMM